MSVLSLLHSLILLPSLSSISMHAVSDSPRTSSFCLRLQLSMSVYCLEELVARLSTCFPPIDSIFATVAA